MSNYLFYTFYFYVTAFIIGTQKLKRLNFLLYYFLIGTILDVLKSVYGAPRPYMIDSNIKAMDDSTGNGHPSGHSLFGIFLFLSIFE